MFAFAQFFARFSLILFDLGLFIGIIYFAVLGVLRSMVAVDYEVETAVQKITDRLSVRKFESARLARGYCVLFMVGWMVFTLFLYLQFDIQNPFE